MKRFSIPAFALAVTVVALLLSANASASNPSAAAPNLTPTPSPTPCSGLSPWTQAQPLGEAAGGPAVGSDGTYVYAADGYDYQAGHLVNYFGRYDPTANTWMTLTNSPDVFDGASAVYAPNTGKLYVFGGFPGNSVPLTTTRIYDPVANSWSSGAPMPDARGGLGAAYGSGKIFLLGGQGPAMSINGQTWAYDPVANSWMTMTAMPAARVAAATAVINGQLYAAGGLDTSFQEDATLFDYDIVSNTWSSRANMPIGIFGGGGSAAGGKLYVTGGGFPSNNRVGRIAGIAAVRNVTLSYDPTTDSWSSGPVLNQPRSFHGQATAGNKLVVVGGDITSSAATNSVEVASLVSCATSTPIATDTPIATSTPIATDTSTATPIATTTPVATDTPLATITLTATDTPASATSTPMATDTPLPLPSATPTDCANPFLDLNGNVFYTAIHYLNCRGVINGTDATHYSPAGTSTRGQFAKVVVLGFSVPFYTPTQPTFSDVLPSYFAYAFIESGYHAGILSGFDNATCTANGQPFPCYLPNFPITRGQLTKLVVNAAHYPAFTPTTPTFSDVPPTNVFYASIETAHHMAVINGYSDGTFRPNNNIRRDEMAQIVYKGVTTP